MTKVIPKTCQPTNTRFTLVRPCEERLLETYMCMRQTIAAAQRSIGFRKKISAFSVLLNSEKAWELDGCGNSGPISKANLALSEIAAIQTARGGGVIHGVVRGSEQEPETTIPGVRVEVRGTTGHFETTTNEKGEFQIAVPAGLYVVSASQDGKSFGKADLSYEDPLRTRIEPGGCAQLELAELERPVGR